MNPMIALDAGFNIYAVKFFHLFVNLRYATGRHLGGPTAYNLSEFTTSFGLGLNVNFWNKKKKSSRGAQGGGRRGDLVLCAFCFLGFA